MIWVYEICHVSCQVTRTGQNQRVAFSQLFFKLLQNYKPKPFQAPISFPSDPSSVISPWTTSTGPNQTFSEPFSIEAQTKSEHLQSSSSPFQSFVRQS